MECMKPRFYSVRGPEIPSAYSGSAFPAQPPCAPPEKKGISTLFQNLQTDDLLLISLIILLLGEGGEDNYIIVIILATDYFCPRWFRGHSFVRKNRVFFGANCNINIKIAVKDLHNSQN